MSLPVRLVTALLAGYRRWISPLKPPCCRFHPTCSQYAIEAFSRHGLARGLWLCTWRLLRCQPFAKGGWDPVPQPKSGSDGTPAPRAQRP